MLLAYAIESGENGHGMDEMSEKHLGHKPISFKEGRGKLKRLRRGNIWLWQTALSRLGCDRLCLP